LQIFRKLGSPVTLLLCLGLFQRFYCGGHRHTITNTEKLTAIEVVLKRASVEFIDENGGGPGVRLWKPPRVKTAVKR
jgi:hypothetical protein